MSEAHLCADARLGTGLPCHSYGVLDTGILCYYRPGQPGNNLRNGNISVKMKPAIC